MAAYRRVYDSRHLQADCQEPGSAPEPYARQSSMGYLYLFYRLIAGLGYGCSLSECDRTVIRPVKTWLRKPERTLLGDPA